MNFGKALIELNEGRMVAREGWNGKKMFIYKTVGNTVDKDFIPKFASLPASVKTFLATRGTDVVFQPSITMFTAAGEMQPGWLASQADMLAEDWVNVSTDDLLQPKSEAPNVTDKVTGEALHNTGDDAKNAAASGLNSGSGIPPAMNAVKDDNAGKVSSDKVNNSPNGPGNDASKGKGNEASEGTKAKDADLKADSKQKEEPKK